jgi:hypothetical protein
VLTKALRVYLAEKDDLSMISPTKHSCPVIQLTGADCTCNITASRRRKWSNISVRSIVLSFAIALCDRDVLKVVEFWLENRLMLEFMPPELATEYLQFMQPHIAQQVFG